MSMQLYFKYSEICVYYVKNVLHFIYIKYNFTMGSFLSDKINEKRSLSKAYD
jgi:hypothetical protein